MGKITGNTLDEVKVKVPRSTGNTLCGAEVVGFLACLDNNNNNEAQCMQSKQALHDCMQVAMSSGVTQRRHKPPVNYHIRTVRHLPLAFFPPAQGSRTAPVCRRVARAPPRRAQFLRSIGAGRKSRR